MRKMAESETEILASRLSRMKTMIDSLEKACSESEEQQQLFRRLKQEMEAARSALKTFDTAESSS